MKLLDVVGARPQFIKLAPILRAIERHNDQHPDSQIQEILVHTGQHYDYEMSGVFFDELGLKTPDYHLGVGSGSHGYQTGEMLKRIEEVLLREKPDIVMVYGDTNSTLAGALAAAKLHIPVAHVEAGLRSFNKRMPEEINRVLTDHVSDILFCPTETAVANLKREGIEKSVYLVGDVMYDAVLLYGELAEKKSSILERLNLRPKTYVLVTVHRAENTDSPERLQGIVEGLHRLAEAGWTIVFPMHPRTRQAMERFGLAIRKANIIVIEPVSYLDMLMLEKHARVILTDSGGVQKEAFFLKVPCVTLREETEWMETVETGWNALVGSEPNLIVQAIRTSQPFRRTTIKPYGDGYAADRMLTLLIGGQKRL